MANPDDQALRQILAETRTIAVVGASDKPTRPSNEIYRYLVRSGQYEVYPVNPTITEINGAQVYSRLADLPVVPDMVDVFRRLADLPSCWTRCSPSSGVRRSCGCKRVCGTTRSPATPKPRGCR